MRIGWMDGWMDGWMQDRSLQEGTKQSVRFMRPQGAPDEVSQTGGVGFLAQGVMN